MCESLEDLNGQLEKKGSKINLIYGEYPSVIGDLIKEAKADAICINKDFTPFAKKRDEQIQTACQAEGISFHSTEDYTLNTLKQALCDRDEFFKKFTPYYKRVESIKVNKPVSCEADNFLQGGLEGKEVKLIEDMGKQFYDHSDHQEVNGGRTRAL